MNTRKTLFTVLAVLVCATSWGVTVGSASEYLAAAKPGTTNITLSKDITFTVGDIPISDDCTVDLGGHVVTLVDMIKNPLIRRGFALGDGSTIQNGTIQNCGWPVYRNAGSTRLITVRGITFKDVQGVAKFGAANQGVTESILIENCRASLTGVPGTIIDIGPGAVRNVTIRDVRTKYTLDPLLTNTGSDGIGIETALGTVLMEDVILDGCLGDAFDIKGTATLRRCWALNASRQAFKVWGRKGKPTTFEDCVALNCGYGSMCNAGNFTVRGCYLQGGWRDNYALMIGAGKQYVPGLKDQWGNDNDYGCGGVDAVVTNSAFIQRRGVSRLIECEKENTTLNVRAANVTFDKCQFYLPTHPHLVIGPWVQFVDTAKAGKWDSHITNSTYGDVSDPVPPTGPPVVVPPVDPPVVIPPVVPPADKVAALEARVAVVEAKLKAIGAVLGGPVQ